MRSWIEQAIGGLERFLGILFLLLFILNLLRIGLRYLWGIAWIWEPDLSRLLFVWIVFLGATLLHERKGHLGVEYFLNRMKPPKREKMTLLIDAISVLFLAVLLVKGVEVTRVRMRIPFDTWDLPTGYAYMAVPVCAAIMIGLTAARTISFLSKRRRKR